MPAIAPAIAPQAAVIVEPRNHSALPLVLCNALSVLPQHWHIYWFHGSNNEALARRLVSNLGPDDQQRMHLVDLGITNLTIQEYNYLLCHRWFWEQVVTASHILVFQTDSILSEVTQFHINDFLKYDYIGAPWQHLAKERLYVGNGGLSLRNKQAILEAIAYFEAHETTLNQNVPEDVRFARFFRKNSHKYYLPNETTAATFSVETWYPDKTIVPFGIHAAYKKLRFEDWRVLAAHDSLFVLLQKSNHHHPHGRHRRNHRNSTCF